MKCSYVYGLSKLSFALCLSENKNEGINKLTTTIFIEVRSQNSTKNDISHKGYILIDDIGEV